MPISSRPIADRKSFQDATAAPRTTAAMYFYKQLDPIFDAALAAANDLFSRPHLYTKLNDQKVVETLAILRSRTGNDELIPSADQRSQMYVPVFGPPDMAANFCLLRDDLLAAAAAFSERVFDTGVQMLRERVRTAHRPLKDFLLSLTGDSVTWSTSKPLDNLAENISFRILRAPGVGNVFGITTAPKSTWPYSEDSNADKLLEELTSKLNAAVGLTHQQASTRQRLAARGAEAIAAVIDYTENSLDIDDDIKSLDTLITKCYTWAAAKNALVI